ncbi:nucleolar protein 6, partial [Aplysia californica]|uniref:Nucleolar protein 6 n=1 Tax=Aplysia californica TaxID=6500 RepID=A0ABM1A0I8_APLCA
MKRIHTEDDEDDPSRDSAASLDTSGVSSTQALPAKKKPRSKQKDSSHEFSSREIARLRHMGAVDHSSLFRLQVTELLKEVSVKGKLRQRLSAAVDALTKLLLALPAGTEHELSDRSWLQTLGVRLPLVETPAGGKGRFRFEPPSKVTAEGSFVLDTIVKPRTEVDLALHIPKSVFQPKDHLNQRCVRKQALYLAHVAAALRGHKDVQGLGFQYHRGNPLKPTLVVSVKGKDCKTVSVRVHARLDPDTFKLSRFDVNKNNIRPRWYLGQGQREEEDGAEATSLPPTPVYNMSVLHDLCAARHLECMRQSVGVSEGLRQGVMLLTVWLRQRQAHEGWGSFPEDLLCSVVALLVGRGQLNTSMTGYQVFRAVLQYLSQADWQTDPPSLCAEVEPSRLVAFTSRFPVVFVDGSGWLNLAYTLTAAALLKVRQEAKLTISALGKSEGQKFQVVFLTHKSFPRSFDYLCHVTIDARSLRRSGERVDNLATAAMDVGGQMSLALTSHLEQLLTSALDDRVTLVCAAPRPNPQWSVNDAPLDYDEQSYLTFGLCLNTSAAFSVLNKGPPADHPEALAFREMWGDKSEMRRFKD